MIKTYKSKSFFSELSFSTGQAIKENKWKIILSCVLVVAGIVGGIVLAVKTDLYGSFKAIQEINMSGFEKGIVASSSAFLSRTFSLLFNVLLLTACSFTIITMPLAELLLTYRGYLFGLNFALIFVFYGFGSALTAIVVILPCQLLTLFCLIVFYVIFSKINSECKKFGNSTNRIWIVVFAFLIVFLINIVETLLLVLLNGKVILVI